MMTVLVFRFGETGPGDLIFVLIWALASLVLAAYYCYRMTQR
jgi:hypothetical protein